MFYLSLFIASLADYNLHIFHRLPQFFCLLDLNIPSSQHALQDDERREQRSRPRGLDAASDSLQSPPEPNDDRRSDEEPSGVEPRRWRAWSGDTERWRNGAVSHAPLRRSRPFLGDAGGYQALSPSPPAPSTWKSHSWTEWRPEISHTICIAYHYDADALSPAPPASSCHALSPSDPSKDRVCWTAARP